MNIIRFSINNIKTLCIRSFSQNIESRIPAAKAIPQTNVNVPGLSANCIKKTSGPVGPGAKVDGEYKVPEYFSYNNMSYYEAEIEMSKFRCPQPKAK